MFWEAFLAFGVLRSLKFSTKANRKKYSQKQEAKKVAFESKAQKLRQTNIDPLMVSVKTDVWWPTHGNRDTQT